MTMILLQQHYRSADASRQAEIDRANALNEASGMFTEIIRVDGATKRWTFNDLFTLAAERLAGRLCVIANSDISFDKSLLSLAELLVPNMLVALTRWDDDAAPSMEGRIDPLTWRFYSQSQDAWIFLGGALPPFRSDFELGVPRCENRLAYEAAAAGVTVLNPAFTIRTWHHHASNVRSWKRSDRYIGPLYFPRLTTLEMGTPEGCVLDRSGWRKREWIATIDPGPPPRLQAARPGHQLPRGPRRLGLRTPLYWRG